MTDKPLARVVEVKENGEPTGEYGLEIQPNLYVIPAGRDEATAEQSRIFLNSAALSWAGEREQKLVEALRYTALMAHMSDSHEGNGQFEDCRKCKEYRDIIASHKINSAVESREKVLRDRIASLESELSKAKDRPKKVCTVCGDETEYGCADCRISFRTTIFVCGKPSCRDEHEKVCPILIKESPDA
jgi:hypothetical protein